MLHFQNVSYSIDKTPILKALNFEVSPREMVAILGASGAGKSTLFRLLTGEKRPSEGMIKLDQFPLRELTPASLQKYRRQIGIVFQDFRLLKGKTVYENIAFALEVCGQDHKTKMQVPQLLESVGLQHKADSFPQTLSGGEAQRVAIARALVHDPKILIADEATGNLDPQNSREIGDIFAKLNHEKGLTIFFATHDPVLVQRLKPRVIKLHNGAILFDKKDATPEEMF